MLVLKVDDLLNEYYAKNERRKNKSVLIFVLYDSVNMCSLKTGVGHSFDNHYCSGTVS